MNFKFVSKVTWGVLVWGMFAGCPGAGPVGALEDGGTDAGVPDAGVIACGDVRSTPQMACGTLSWSASPTASRPRNHHFTFISETPAGAYLFALGGAEDGLIMSNADSAPLSADGQVGAWKRTTNKRLGAEPIGFTSLVWVRGTTLVLPHGSDDIEAA
ncbi:MAG: hypothetical protein K1X64_23400 [Myxococcaceae bacterium]|nr:hypothetical protein [Myxococcaceae bacterium]